MPGNEVSIVISADTQDLKAQLAGARQDIEASVGSRGTLGASLQQTGVLFDQFGRRASGSVNEIRVSGSMLAGAFSGAAAPITKFGDETRKAHQELFEGARRTRSFVDALGQAVPALSGVTGRFTQLSRETSGFTVGQVAATGALLAGAAAIGYFVSQATELIRTQAAVNKAIGAMDFSAAQAGLSGVIDKIREWDTANQTLASRSISSEGLAGIGAWIVKIQNSLADTTGQAKAWAAGMAQTWESFGRGKAILEATKAELEASVKAFGLLATQAPTIQALAGALDRQAQATRDAAQATINLQRNEDERALAAARDESLVLFNKGLVTEALQKASIANEQYALRSRQHAAEEEAADTALAQSKIANAATVAAARQREFADAGKLAQIDGQRAVAALEAARAETEYSQGAAAARRLIVAAANEELATVTRVYEAERQAQLATIAGLADQPLAQQAAYRQLAQLDETYAGNREKVFTDLAGKLRANDAQILADTKAVFDRTVAYGGITAAEIVTQYARMATAAGQSARDRVQAEGQWAQQVLAFHAQVTAAGRAEADAAIAALKEQYGEYVRLADVERKSADQRKKAADTLRTYLSGGVVAIKGLTEAFAQADLAQKALDLGFTGFGSRIQASARSALDALQGIPRTAMDAAAKLGQAGVAASKFGEGAKASGDAAQAAFKFIPDEIDNMIAAGRAFNENQRQFAAPFQIGRDAAGELVIQTGEVAQAAAGAGEALAGAFGDVKTEGVDKLAASFKNVGDAIRDGMSSGLAEGRNLIQDFWNDVNEANTIGAGRLADSIADQITRRLIEMLDNERNRA